MNSERLSNRLEAVASFVNKGAVVADIGSDHAYLPCFLIHTGKVRKAVAGEVAKGPYESAVKNVLREGLSEVITIRLADGLFAIEESDAVDTVTIAGMGGPLIATILDRGKERLAHINRIITQPNIYARAIREWAVVNGWKVADERILKEDGKLYEIIVLEKGQSAYGELELMAGPILLDSKTDVFYEKWENEMVEWKRVLDSLEKASETDAIKTKKAQLKSHIDLVGKVLAT
ncbi:tRNA (adenine(22)-N(1))-methyltransferase TrmK [Sporosarcina sp. JAI121]|uniref:tRNA (adenine(22)-N(1))-methyltransferase n=1 Tax=Sporosarcina sp. JAI121 TaxID=2723064 RepID=UPI0015CAFEB4|nr:tRNA (adenine(22)-N(1))-methyltransferase TrmK [Sporosarcina sp. JAI121]NYF24563.1 tRNA (adenine22-N1)-methyltransferase [Sporosarcina sp. JAI121]